MAMNFYRSDGWVKTTQGPAVSGAQVYILSQPANVTPPITPPRSTPVPFTPNPQVQVYSDAGFTPVVQPVITDGFGHYDFYVLPGLYTVAIYYGGKLQQYYVDQSIGNVGSSSGTSILLSTNNTPNFNQSALNLVQGAGIEIVTDNFGNAVITNLGSLPSVVLKTNGVLNGNQALQNLVNGAGIAMTQDGAGNVTVASTITPTPPAISPRNIWSTESLEAGVPSVGQYGPGGTGSQVWTYPFTLALGTVIGHISTQVYNETTQPFSCGIYSLDGTVLYVEAQFSGLNNSWQTVAITPVTLPPGAYRFAYGLGGSTLTTVYGVDISDALGAPNYSLFNLGPVPYTALCSSTLTGGYTMPATLGSFTAVDRVGWCSFLLQP